MIPAPLAVAAAYLIGSIPSSIIAGKVVRGRHFDIREHGSGNAGATNVFRTLGLVPALCVFLFDSAKGYAAAAMPLTSWLEARTTADPFTLSLLCGMAAVAGHAFPVFAGFRGGKAVATTAGFLLVVFPWGVLICLGIWIVMLLLTGYVSVSSLLAAAALPLVLWLDPRGPKPVVVVVAIVAALLIVFLHRSNIRRLLHGTENRFERARLFSKLRASAADGERTPR